MLGEIRDQATASIAVQAALSGHRLISTMHAGRPEGAIARLFEMGLEPYQIASALFGVIAQRLLRKRDKAQEFRGRVPIAEFGSMDSDVRQAILDRGDSESLRERIRMQSGYRRMRDVAHDLVRQGVTDTEEVSRVVGSDDEHE